MTRLTKTRLFATLVMGSSLLAGCSHFQTSQCETCPTGYESCDAGGGGWGWGGGWSWAEYRARFWSRFRSHAIPEVLPLGVTVRAHYQAMETNAEAVDFILYQHDFILETAELTPDGKDKLLEISARMRSAPFPVLVERSENNSNPELDAYRRDLIAQILTDLGNPDADQRTIVSTPYGPGYNSIESERDWYQHIGGGGNNNFNNFGNNGFGGAGGGGFGGGGLY